MPAARRSTLILLVIVAVGVAAAIYVSPTRSRGVSAEIRNRSLYLQGNSSVVASGGGTIWLEDSGANRLTRVAFHVTDRGHLIVHAQSTRGLQVISGTVTLTGGWFVSPSTSGIGCALIGVKLTGTMRVDGRVVLPMCTSGSAQAHVLIAQVGSDVFVLTPIGSSSDLVRVNVGNGTSQQIAVLHSEVTAMVGSGQDLWLGTGIGQLMVLNSATGGRLASSQYGLRIDGLVPAQDGGVWASVIAHKLSRSALIEVSVSKGRLVQRARISAIAAQLAGAGHSLWFLRSSPLPCNQGMDLVNVEVGASPPRQIAVPLRGDFCSGTWVGVDQHRALVFSEGSGGLWIAQPAA